MSAVDQAIQDLFQICQNRLGEAARLGVSATLFGPKGEPRSDVAYNEYERFPMASVVKVPLAMFLASEIANGSLSLYEQITIRSRAASPGLIGNPLDRFYFWPFDTIRTYTVNELIGSMLQNSDNTATDVLLRRVGGMSALAKFLTHELHADGISLDRTMDQLLTFYFQLDRCDASEGQGISRRIRNIVGNIPRLASPYNCRPTREQHLIDSGEETCTPRGMADLLRQLALNPKYALVYSHMQRCATNKRRIAEGLKEHRSVIKSFGHKTGSLGAI